MPVEPFSRRNLATGRADTDFGFLSRYPDSCQASMSSAPTSPQCLRVSIPTLTDPA